MVDSKALASSVRFERGLGPRDSVTLYYCFAARAGGSAHMLLLKRGHLLSRIALAKYEVEAAAFDTRKWVFVLKDYFFGWHLNSNCSADYLRNCASLNSHSQSSFVDSLSLHSPNLSEFTPAFCSCSLIRFAKTPFASSSQPRFL